MDGRYAYLSLLLLGAFGLDPAAARGAVYRVLPTVADVLPGSVNQLRIEVESQNGDNLINHGLFSFSIELTVAGTAGATATAISSVLINDIVFDDVEVNFVGYPSGNRYVDIGGVTSDIALPNVGHQIGDVTWLFSFDFTAPHSALPGEYITITPSEGIFENLIVNDRFDNVTPQVFESVRLAIIPEPSTAFFAVIVMATLAFRVRKQNT